MVRQLFEYEKYVCFDEVKNISKCLLCEKVLTGKITSNIKRHYETVHGKKITNTDEVQSTAMLPSSSKRRSNSISITMDKNEFILCCVGLVTVKHMPFRIFDDDDYFKKIIRPYEEHYKININSRNIVDKVNTVANKIKEKISKNVFKKMMCLKIDVATRMDKSILGINIQYVKESKIYINTIGMVQLKRRHTSHFLKGEIINCLKEFNIDISQIYACTSDNGANVIKTSKLLADLQEEMQNQPHEDAISDDEEYLNIHSSLTSVLGVVRCAAHTIQLAAYDVIKTIGVQVDECRKIVKTLRTMIRNENKDNLCMPPLDNVTRWNSTFNMLKALEGLKEYIENVSEPNIGEVDWNFVTGFLNAFRPLTECTIKFQSEQYIVGDFYRDWLFCEVELEELQTGGNVYAAQLSTAMNSRKQNLLSADSFVAAIYLDARFNFAGTPFLTEEQKKNAVVSVFHFM